MTEPTSLFLVTAPGLQNLLADEARAAGFVVTSMIPGGVSLKGGWAEAMRANLVLRGATRVLARVAEFPAAHMAELDKRARRLPWSDWLRPSVPVSVGTASHKSKLYHLGAIKSRVEGALTANGFRVESGAPVRVMVRIDADVVTVSIDTSGELLHKRGLKVEVNKAPMRETLASLFLRACGFDGSEPVVDPMCGSGTFVIEAAEVAMGLAPGRVRDFAFEQLAAFDKGAWREMKSSVAARDCALSFTGSDRDAGAVRMAAANAERAGVSEITRFHHRSISDAEPPEGPAGLVIVNPPYGARVGAAKPLYPLYASFGKVMKARFRGWRVGMVTSDAGLAKAADLDWAKPGPVVDHGGIKVRLWQAVIS